MNNPFYYEPHPLCVEAAHKIIADVCRHPEWTAEVEGGKMFGVLVTPDITLMAYSGQILGRSDWEGYVPAVFDYLEEDGYFKRHERDIVRINKEIECLSHSEDLMHAREFLYNIEKQKPMEGEKAKESDYPTREEWVRRRQYEKAELHRARLRWRSEVEEARQHLQSLQNRITALKQERRLLSDALQQWLFSQFVMLNARGEEKSLLNIFFEWAERTGSRCKVPPSGSGECCAPKLLQYAYRHGLTPIAIAEFTIVDDEPRWRGACDSRCKPILDWMLQGTDVAPNPLEQEESHTTLTILYEDENIIAIDKPAGMLSVPGKSNRKSALDILRGMRPDIPELFMAHRLDMQTSGVLIAAKSLINYKELQRLFLDHKRIRKTYYAILQTPVRGAQRGTISLPLSADYINRPRQVVDKTHGKDAITEYQIIDPEVLGLSSSLRGRLVRLHPLTGRTHQLRVHCAHPEGLGTPILGDDLYGAHSRRLYLHAQRIDIDGLIIESPLHVSLCYADGKK